MDKKKIEEFATTARRQLIENLTYEASRIGITPTEIQQPTTEAEDIQTFTTGSTTNTLYAKQIEQRNQLIEEIENNGFEQTIEKIAYTWFNRIIAIRFMEINNYLPTHTRVLSSITPGKKEPDIITEALNIDLDYTEEEIEQIYKYKTENLTDKLFKLLFIKQCNKLNEILPELFETIDDYTEILFNIQLSNENNIINRLIETITEEDFTNQVEIIGWMYQYYNKELKDETYKNIKKQKVGKDRIPAVTQLFTPDWIVKYMVENSLGRLWLENHENNELKNNWKYYIDEAEQTEEVQKQLEEIKSTYKDIKPEEIKILDPSMGSGHILVYVFDVLMQIYTSQGYTEKEATISILENNIYGIDIDDRAYQLAYFAVMMKARSYNRRILNQNITPHLIAIQETNNITEELIEKINSKKVTQLIEIFKNGKTLGSIIKINFKINYDELEETLNNIIQKISSDISLISHQNEIYLLKDIIHQTKILNKKYDIVITNPPYMGNSNMNNILKDYIKKEYPNTKQDLFSVFMEQGFDLIKKNAFNVMVTMQSWMFLSTFEKFRQDIIKNSYIVNLLHMGNQVMGIAFGTSATIFRKIDLVDYNAIYNFIEYKNLNTNGIPYDFPVKINENYCNSFKNYFNIPKIPFSYWVNESVINSFNNVKLKEIASVRQGIITGNNSKFLRFNWEIDITKLNNKWIPCAKGGDYKKYWGNNNRVIDWSEKSKKTYPCPRSKEIWFKKGITFSSVSSKGTGFRYLPKEYLFINGGNSIININDDNFLYILGFLNSKISFFYLKILNPTLNINLYNIEDLPIIFDNHHKSLIEKLTLINMKIAKEDWDNNEFSLDFKQHPLMLYNKKSIIESYNKYSEKILNNQDITKNNEECINTIFSEIYHIDNIDLKMEKNDITLKRDDNKTIMESFISYVLGCIFGRYSLDESGLIFAGGEFDINKYHSLIPDRDNIVPVLDEEYFDDDIVNQIMNFIKVAFGEEILEENLDFIAESLDVAGKSSREVIRNYMIKKFYSNHTRMYQKCPIYWMFDSGKENAFKCLVYMHRYEPDLVSKIRFDYLHKTQRAIEDNIKLQESIINESENKSRVNKANKKKTKLIKQLDEIKLYDLALAHVANERIEIDLDDGVKVNYAKFQNIEVVDPNTNKTRKINLLKKI